MGPLPRLGRLRLGRVRTASAFIPAGVPPKERLLEEFERLQNEQVTLVRASEGLPLDRVKIVSPFDRRVRYNLFAALSMLPRHQHRHLQQAEQVWAGVRARE